MRRNNHNRRCMVMIMKNAWLFVLIVFILALIFWDAVQYTYEPVYTDTYNDFEPDQELSYYKELTSQLHEDKSGTVSCVFETKPSPGIFKITVYTPYCDNGKWGYSTATGIKSEHLATCAVDPEVIPLGSEITVNGLTLRAVDTGSAVKGRTIDIFYDGTAAEALSWISGFGNSHEVSLKATK